MLAPSDMPDTIWTYDVNGNPLYGVPNFAKPGVAERVAREALAGEINAVGSTYSGVDAMRAVNRLEEQLR